MAWASPQRGLGRVCPASLRPCPQGQSPRWCNLESREHTLRPPLLQPQKLGANSEALAADSVRAISVSTLYLVSTTVDRMGDVSAAHPPPGTHRAPPDPSAWGSAARPPGSRLPCRCPQVLWPYLFEFLVPVRFTGALTPLCRSLVHLAQKRQEAGAHALLIQYNGNGAPPALARPPSPP